MRDYVTRESADRRAATRGGGVRMVPEGPTSGPAAKEALRDHAIRGVPEGRRGRPSFARRGRGWRTATQLLPQYSGERPESSAESKAAAERALALDQAGRGARRPRHGGAEVWGRWRTQTGSTAGDRAEPRLRDRASLYRTFLSNIGRYDEAIAESGERWRSIPVDTGPRRVGTGYAYRRRFERRSGSIAKGWSSIRSRRCSTAGSGGLLLAGRLDEATRTFAKAVEIDPGSFNIK